MNRNEGDSADVPGTSDATINPRRRTKTPPVPVEEGEKPEKSTKTSMKPKDNGDDTANSSDVPGTSNTRRRTKTPPVPVVKGTTQKTKKKEGSVDKSIKQKQSEEEEDKYDDKYLAPIQSIFSEEKLVKTEELKEEIKETRKALKGCYNEIKVDYEESVKNELFNEYAAWIEKTKKEGLRNIYRENVIKQNGYIVPYPKGPLPDNDIKTGEATVTWIKPDRDEQGIVQKKVRAPLSRVEVGDVNPPMVYWVPIEQSIISKDQLRLTHMPYFGDVKDDTDVYNALIKIFPDGIHGFSGNWSYINDYLLYKLLRAALPNFKGKPDIFYYALYSMYPNKTSQRELTSVFPQLCAKFAEISFDPAPFEPWKPLKSYKVAENAQDPHCYACLHHMCPVHGFKAELTPDFSLAQYFHCELPLPNSVKSGEAKCSKNCWKSLKIDDVREQVEQLNHDAVEEKSIPIYLKKHNIIKMKIEDGSTIASMYGYNNKVPFCEFAATAVDEYDDECAIRSCRDAYMLILSLAAKVEERRLIATDPPRKLSMKDRVNNFRNVQKRLETLKKKQRHEKLREQAMKDGTDVTALIAEDDRREAQQNDEAVRLTAVTKITACRHNGPCLTSEDCACRENGLCSYMCSCDINCAQRFPGCNCVAGQCASKACQCYRANWECSPLTCRKCQCDAIDEEDPNSKKCKNFGMNRMIQKKMYCAPSKIAGNGLFLLEPVDKDEFITEYVGERISDDEAERRGAIYDRYQCSYIFNLETGGAIDSYKVGNLARFANHDSNAPTLYARTMVVAGEHRIGFYAKRKLEINDELTFDYSYSGEHQIAFKMVNMKNSMNAASSSSSSSVPSTSASTSSTSTSSSSTSAASKVQRRVTAKSSRTSSKTSSAAPSAAPSVSSSPSKSTK